MLDLRHQEAERTEYTGRRRDQHLADRQRAGNRCRHHRAVAAKSDQHEVARIASAIGRHRLDGAGHGRGRDRVDAVGDFGERQAERPCDALFQGGARPRGIELHAAACERDRVEIARGECRVGEGRLGAARRVADRTRHRARAARADRKIAGAIERHDRPATRADFGHVDERQLDRIAAAFHELARQVDAGADLVLGGARGLAVLDHGGLGRRAAHVERNRVGKTRARAPCGRSRSRPPRGRIRPCRPASRARCRAT